MRRFLLQAMETGVVEVLLGLRHSPETGPVVVLGAGGVFTELYQDVALRLAPVGRAEAERRRAQKHENSQTAANPLDPQSLFDCNRLAERIYSGRSVSARQERSFGFGREGLSQLHP